RGRERVNPLDVLAHHLAEALAAAAVPEVLLLGAGPRDNLERRVGDVVAHLVAHHDLGTAADLDVVDDVLVVVRQELGQLLFGLVEVVVGVEHRIRELAGHFRLLKVSFALVVMTLPRLDQRKHRPRRTLFSDGYRAGQTRWPGRTRPLTQKS